MGSYEWLRDQGKGTGKKDSASKPVSNSEETLPADEPPESRKKPPLDEVATVVEIRGESFDPMEQISVLALVDIAPDVLERRGVPQFFHIRSRETVLGTARRAHVKVDDLKTVKSEHGLLVFRKGAFRIYPQMGDVCVDGEPVTQEGAGLKNGARIQMGSAEFVFMSVWEPEEAGETTGLMDDDDATRLSP